MRRASFESDVPQLDDLGFAFQPIVPVDGGCGGWSEALLRWRSPAGDLRGPAEVLPKLLAPARQAAFTRFTLERAAAVVAAVPGIVLSVNLSPAQVMDPTALGTLQRLLPSVRSRLRIELTEQPVYDAATLWGCVKRIRESCDVVLLDDVTPQDLDLRSRSGAPFDGVKLDRSVVALLADREHAARVRSFVSAVAERYRIVVAEGIEDVAVCQELVSLGVSHVQGFGIALPGNEIAGPEVSFGPESFRGPRDVVRSTVERHL